MCRIRRSIGRPMLARRSLDLGTQYVLRSVDGGNHWTQISPDLTGAKKEAMKIKGEIPAQGAGTFTNRESIGVKDPDPPTVANAIERGHGTIFTIAPSPRDAGLIWTGSDTGLVYLTRNGGQSWANVTPPGVQPWAKISLIEASHFDSAVAYVAGDRHRLDDRTPYLYRARDFGKTWTKMRDGMSDPDLTYVVREDSKQKGRLLTGTDDGVYASFDDGDHWRPLKLNLPAVSVRDIDVHGDDLVIATHGRAFWILDDMTPLRQVAKAGAKRGPFFHQPETTIRLDHDPFPARAFQSTSRLRRIRPKAPFSITFCLCKLSLLVSRSMTRRVAWCGGSPRPRVYLLRSARPLWRRHGHATPLGGEPSMHRFVWGLRWCSTGEMDPDFPDAGGQAQERRGCLKSRQASISWC
jgi:hypothetical protein